MTKASLDVSHVQERYSMLSTLAIKGTPILTAAAVATGCVYVSLSDPESNRVFPTCGFYALTGLYCPGCGMTRSMYNITRGNIGRAFQYNALLVVGLPVLMYLYVWWATWAFTEKRLATIPVSTRGIVTVVGLVALFCVGRNLPGEAAHYFSLGR